MIDSRIPPFREDPSRIAGVDTSSFGYRRIPSIACADPSKLRNQLHSLSAYLSAGSPKESSTGRGFNLNVLNGPERLNDLNVLNGLP